MSSRTNVGWIGLGNMGSPMALRLLAAGYPVAVYNRSPEKTAALSAAGATVATSPAALLPEADVIFCMVSDDAAVRTLFTGPEGLLQAPATGKLFINMSTVSPGISQELAARSHAQGNMYLDAPVSGSVKQAESGQLVIMVGGEAPAFEQAQPLLVHLGKLSRFLGPAGNGNLAKLAMNTLLAFQAQGLAEALLFAQQHGLQPADLLPLIGSSALSSVFTTLKGEVVLAGNYQAAFALKLLAKDLRLAKAEGLSTPLAKVVCQTFQQAEPALGDEDVMAIIKYLDHSSDKQG